MTPRPASNGGACVAQCPNGAAQLFTSAKVSHLASCRRAAGALRARGAHGGDHGRALPQLHHVRRVRSRLSKEISLDFIARMNRDYIAAKFKNRKSEATADFTRRRGGCSASRAWFIFADPICFRMNRLVGRGLV